MTIATFSVPIDIPWQRIAFSSDMMDRVACDREFPLRWRSSVAIFEYEPPEDQQRIDGFKVSYLKVACSITGYQPDDQEIRIRERLNRSGWGQKKYSKLEVDLNDAVNKYHACYGAMLEVVVVPPEGDNVRLKDYPYFADFDPKKRELYEQVTDTGEMMSRSLEDAGVRLGQTTSQSHEVYDKTTVAGEVKGTVGVVSAKGSAAYESGTTDLTQRSTENVRTTDALRENRETLSHTTQLSQMYHQLNSYHLGTNRAAFFVQPRPHVVQSTDPDGTPRTFVDGPRQLEGIQEFMLVVVRPKSQESICVEAYLETAHLSRKPLYGPGTTATLVLNLDSATGAPATLVSTERGGGKFVNHYSKTASARYPNDGSTVVIDTDRGAGADTVTGKPGGYDIASINPAGADVTFEVAPDHVLVRGNVSWRTGMILHGFDPEFIKEARVLDVNATVYLKSSTIVGYEDVLLITAREVCSCGIDRSRLAVEKDPSIVYEKQLAQAGSRQSGTGEAMSIHDANRLGARIHREVIQSLSSADRYPRGAVSLLDTQLVAGPMAAAIRYADRDVNARLADWAGIDKKLARRVTAYAPAITRSQLLEMPLARQVETFGLSLAEAVEIRRSLIDLDEPVGPPPVPERSQVEVPLLTGLQSNEAEASLAAAGLSLGPTTVVDSPLPAGSVVAQEPAADVTVEPETEVSVQLASGLSVRLPEVIGVRLSEATCRLRDAGLRSEPTVEGQPGPDAHVVALEPPAGTLVTPNTPVTIRLEHRSRE